MMKESSIVMLDWNEDIDIAPTYWLRGMEHEYRHGLVYGEGWLETKMGPSHRSSAGYLQLSINSNPSHVNFINVHLPISF